MSVPLKMRTTSIDRQNQRVSTCPLGLVSIAAWVIGLPRCSCEYVWEEIMKRFEKIEVVGEPDASHSSFVKGILNSCHHPIGKYK